MVISYDISNFKSTLLTAVLTVVFLSLGIIPLSRIIYNIYLHPLCNYPGPKLYAATGLAHSRMVLSGRAHKKLEELHKQYGPVVRIGPNIIDWADPRAFKDLMGHSRGSSTENYRDPIKAGGKPYGIIYANREDHARIRRVLAHGFSAQSMVKQQPLIQNQINLLIQRLHENCENGKRALNMVAWYNFATFDIMGDLAFGEPFGCLERSDYHPWVSSIFDSLHARVYRNAFKQFWITSQLTKWLIPENLKQKENLHQQLSKDKIQRRIASSESRPDFIQSMMMREGALAMSKLEIEATADTLIIGGSETTGTVLSGATFFLMTHPDAMARVAKEVRSSFSAEQEIDILSVQKLQYMLAALDETMRLYPVLPTGISRIIKPGGDYICEKFVPEGTRVMISQWPMYRDKKRFVQPDDFIPERFLDDPKFKDEDKGALQPFGYGPRNCIGRNLAIAEMRVILARVIWNFDLQIAEDSRNWLEQDLYGIWKKGPLNVRLIPRKGT
ncbi:cytochrome P450 [Colletotrichum navitas]|uniref:Cytochrome P450 n=1 Tax=Colletotrichum navitas TaxID=681940 RepID=A0AAD8PMJ9_9PEZI|nr:cytochrome P450 [Colletotrichum navitas]KAK1570070.1 cytochrome P450 [Colletotrichum navitas]